MVNSVVVPARRRPRHRGLGRPRRRRVLRPHVRARAAPVLSTNHLCGKGYWVWLIPLVLGPDLDRHRAPTRAFTRGSEMNTLDERDRLDPRARAAARRGARRPARPGRGLPEGRALLLRRPSRRSPASDRWCLVGEAGAFLDPFYSPGSDYIAIANTLTHRPDHARARRRGRHGARRGPQRLLPERLPDAPDLVRGPVRVLGQPAGHEREDRRQQHLYWGGLGLLFFHRKFTDLDFMAAVRPDLERIWAITRSSRRCTASGTSSRTASGAGRWCPRRAFPAMFERHIDMVAGFDDEHAQGEARRDRRPDGGLRGARLHAGGAEPRRRARPTRTRRSTPTRSAWTRSRWEADGLFNGEGMSVAEARADAGRRHGEPVHGGDRPARLT